MRGARRRSCRSVRIMDGRSVAGLVVERGRRVCGVRLDGRRRARRRPRRRRERSRIAHAAMARGRRCGRTAGDGGAGRRRLREPVLSPPRALARRLARRSWSTRRRPGTRLGVLFPGRGRALDGDARRLVRRSSRRRRRASSWRSREASTRPTSTTPSATPSRSRRPRCTSFPSNRRRHYERVRDLPDGLAVLGDAFCSFNPIYGQGMTTGALARADARPLSRRERRGRTSARGFAQPIPPQPRTRHRNAVAAHDDGRFPQPRGGGRATARGRRSSTGTPSACTASPGRPFVGRPLPPGDASHHVRRRRSSTLHRVPGARRHARD